MRKIVWGLFGAAVVMAGCVDGIEPQESAPTIGRVVLSDDEIALLTERTRSPKLDPSEIERTLDDVRRLLGNAAGREENYAGPETSVPETRSPNATRTVPAARTVARIRPLIVETTIDAPTRNGTRNGGITRADTLFHIVDFDDGRGYCIIAADRRLPDPVVCFTENGSFPAGWPGRQIENPGLALMIDATRNYALRWIDRRREWSDSVATALLTRTGAASLDDIPLPDGTLATPDPDPATRSVGEPLRPAWRFNRRIGPLLPVEWSQGRPFNLTVVDSTRWSSTPVGCVALATVQVMAYWKHPTSFHGLAGGNIDWDELRRWSGPQWNRKTGYGEWDGPMSAAPTETQRLVADILWHVGDDIGMNYGASVSTAYTYQVVRLLAEAGFSQGRGVKYSDAEVVRQLDARRPVMIDGASHRSEYGSHANAHAWVIDGLMEDRWWDARTIDHHFYRVERFRRFLHNNFGWGGTDNGWYAAGVFDANNNPDLPSGSQTTPASPDGTRTGDGTRAETIWYGDHYNYQFMQTIYVDIFRY